MELTEVRLFGSLRVRRGDGSYVETGEWRTAPTRSLLGLLSQAVPYPVPVERVLDSVWPGVDTTKSRARLRTAASQIRKAVGAPCVEREGDALVLRDCWVDSEAFEVICGQARRYFLRGRYEEGVNKARDALGLYGGDLCDDLAPADWITPRRSHFQRLHLELLVETAEAMLQAGWHREAVTTAARAAGIDPCDERACRVLMEGHRHLGETDRALLAFDHCSAAMVEALGTDPSAETDMVHRSLLQRRQVRPAPPPLVGRDRLLEELLARANHSFTHSRAQLLHVTGQAGSGKSRLLDEVASKVDAHTVLIRIGVDSRFNAGATLAMVARSLGHAVPSEAGESNGLAVQQPTLVCVDDTQWADPVSLQQLSRGMTTLTSPLVVLTAGTGPVRDATRGVTTYRVGALPQHDAVALLGHVLGTEGKATLDDLDVQGLVDRSGGLPGGLLEEAWRLQAGGLLGGPQASGPQTEPTAGQGSAGSPAQQVEATRAKLPGDALAVLDVLAVLDRPVHWDDLERLTAAGGGSVREGLDVLHDAGLLRVDDDGYGFAHDDAQDAAYRWLRPSVRRRIHQQLASSSSDVLSHDERLRHWVAAGGSKSAPTTSWEKTGRVGRAEKALRLSVMLGESPAGTPSDEHLQTLMTICSAAADHHDVVTATHASDLAIAMATDHHPGALPELYRFRAQMMLQGEDAMAWCEQARSTVDPDQIAQRSSIESVAGRLLSRWSQPLAKETHLRAVRLADDAADAERQVRSRAYLVEELLAGRHVDQAERAAKSAADIADNSGQDLLRSIGLRSIAQPARMRASDTCLHTLRRAWRLSNGHDHEQTRVLCLLAQTQHDFGREGVEDALELARKLADGTSDMPLWHLTAAHIRLDQGNLESSADHLAEGMHSERWGAVNYTWAHLLSGRLSALGGDQDMAATSFHQVLTVSRHSGATLWAGEASARMAMVLATTDTAAAERALAAVTELVGAGMFPREQSVLLLARGRLLHVQGHTSAGMAMARAAKNVANQAGLVHVATEAESCLAKTQTSAA